MEGLDLTGIPHTVISLLKCML